MAYMEVLLSEDVDNLGERGQVVRVRAGYGRNYLLPQGLATEATPGNRRMIDEKKRILAKREVREKVSAEGQAGVLGGLEIIFDRRVGEHGILYGSVTSLDIVEELKKKGHTIERRRISLREPIKQVGEFDVVVKLHRDVNPSIKVIVRKEGAERPQAAVAEAAVAEAAEVQNGEAPAGDSTPQADVTVAAEE
jgi:large subunit ribosomal protein L9